ncbi:MAG: SUMF1/EgtB/PvdO family nonheme iron enzyme, partial [Opitutales bacterium]|nr:SUMF1/EgtB/PvdO family nonheme iron enzyme [Opitutales bacterium]
MKRYKLISLFIFCLAGTYVQAAPPFISYAGQVASGGQPYQGTGQFKFAFVNTAGDATYWSQDGTSTSGSEPTGFVSTQVNGGYYSILLGNTAISGMGAIDPSLFKTYSDIHLRVWFSDGVAAFEEMSPHRPFASVPYALNAGVAAGEITANQLSEQVLKYFKPELIQSPQAPANVYTGQQITLGAQVQGKHLTYQWQRDGQSIPGATNAQFIITDANASVHDGNYSLMISNDFGDVTTSAVQIVVSTGQASTHTADLNASVALEMIWVQPGSFTMGSPTTEAGRSTITDRETEHNVTLTNGFYLGKYEVTQAQYEAVMTGNTDSLSATPSQYGGNADRPVEMV